MIAYLDRHPGSIDIYATPMLGPTLPASPPLPPLREVFKLLGFVNDLKSAISNMQEFIMVDKASLMFEKASGCEIHRDAASGKCKFLPLGRWRGTLQQEDLPIKYIKLSDHLDVLGVELKATCMPVVRHMPVCM